MKSIRMFVKILVCVGVTILSIIVTDVVICVPNYYHDEQVVGWTKLHKAPATFKEAYLMCYYEGATLASPINEALADILDDRRKTTFGVLWSGIHSLFSDNDFLSAEGISINDMPITVSYGFESNENCIILTANRRAKTSNCTRLLPYMCYRHRRNTEINFKCGTFDIKYQYESRTGSCYKLHEDRQEWSRAHLICTAEGGHLAVINNEEEANILKNMSSKRTLRISKYADWEPLFIGLRDWNMKGVWSTVQGDPIENVYHIWGWGQPDNLGRKQYCGSLLKTGKLDDTWCHVKAMFMCEKDPAKARFEYPSMTSNTEPDLSTVTED